MSSASTTACEPNFLGRSFHQVGARQPHTRDPEVSPQRNRHSRSGSRHKVFERYAKDIALIIHTAAQPSHDWAASNPTMDFTVNANGTSVLLEATRKYAPNAVFIFTSTNKVYGDTPNLCP